MKRAQISIYIILSVIVVLIVVISSIIYFGSEEEERNFISSDLSGALDGNEVKNFEDAIKKCVDLEIEYSTQGNLIQGGYHSNPPYFINMDRFLKTPYYILNSNNISPTVEILEAELEKTLDENIKICQNEIRIDFKEAYDSIVFKNISSNVDILNSSIVVDFSMPTDIKTLTGETVSFSQYSTEVDSDILSYYSIVQEFISIHEDDFTQIPISRLSELSMKNNFTYTMQPYNYETVIYTFEFLDSEENIEYIYKFAIEYDWEVAEE